MLKADPNCSMCQGTGVRKYEVGLLRRPCPCLHEVLDEPAVKKSIRRKTKKGGRSRAS